mmetsp:Transcript_15936/g.23134  ORF Transcript_15936/g.23134 Transcript_15936/m.23134 type:complete len:125 (+) Transcript_15936:164-538(+)
MCHACTFDPSWTSFAGSSHLISDSSDDENSLTYDFPREQLNSKPHSVAQTKESTLFPREVQKQSTFYNTYLITTQIFLHHLSLPWKHLSKHHLPLLLISLLMQPLQPQNVNNIANPSFMSDMVI